MNRQRAVALAAIAAVAVVVLIVGLSGGGGETDRLFAADRAADGETSDRRLPAGRSGIEPDVPPVLTAPGVNGGAANPDQPTSDASATTSPGSSPDSPTTTAAGGGAGVGGTGGSTGSAPRTGGTGGSAGAGGAGGGTGGSGGGGGSTLFFTTDDSGTTQSAKVGDLVLVLLEPLNGVRYSDPVSSGPAVVRDTNDVVEGIVFTTFTAAAPGTATISATSGSTTFRATVTVSA